ncbi:hypothetical protein [Spartinivicinus poritis]|uniref:Uncharacterized protein n=1 Tax=Spartinivicinus poritis TaxID=2994640 RepID=A0ABT5UIW8_9GAMM|nr:hypothetical protein [Spartinivicinus sp. A2-2]MDE1465373.1 hypothetical protein [Spartinivicinus sp. A2-2]
MQPPLTAEIKPLSVNEAYYGKKVKTKKYRDYEEELFSTLPDLIIPEGKLTLELLTSYSNTRADIDNALKPFIDILQKRYSFNDNKIFRLFTEKQVVKRGEENLKFRITPFNGYSLW